MHYYNEHDPKAAAWLRALIDQGEIPLGIVDERSITDIRPDELGWFTQCHFFAGIGGWPLALRLAGWPEDRPVWTGSCPCQPFSSAGKGLAEKDPRHLWPVFRNLIAECRPAIVFGEQVASKAGREWLSGVFTDLEGLAYLRAGADLCAAGVGAPHIRQRLYWLADTNGRHPGPEWKQRGRQLGLQPQGQGSVGMADTDDRGCQQLGEFDGNAIQSGFQSPRGPDTNGCREDGWLGNTSGPQLHVGFRDQNSPRGPGSPNAGALIGMDHSRGERRRKGGDDHGGDERIEPHTTIESFGMGDSKRERRSGQSFPILGPAPENYWSAFQLLPCLDGKARRIEPGTFPLAYGIPGRVGLLRGYGNAIVPQVAAQFIASYLDVAA